MKIVFVLFLCLALALTAKADDIENDPAKCFTYYGKLDRDSDTAYEETVFACWGDAKEERKKVDESTKTERAEIEKSSGKSNADLSACDKQKDSLNYFDCNRKAADEVAIFNIKQLSAKVYDRISENYRIIKIEEDRCLKTADVKHAELKYNITTSMSDCIYNKKPLPEDAVPNPTKKPKISKTVVKDEEKAAMKRIRFPLNFF